jgi:hypothetical protein
MKLTFKRINITKKSDNAISYQWNDIIRQTTINNLVNDYQYETKKCLINAILYQCRELLEEMIQEASNDNPPQRDETENDS